MRLLNVESRQLHTYYDDTTPPYAILSHTWDQTEPEVSFEDMKNPAHVNMKHYDKIENTCKLAKTEGIEWVWIDTCCIDKSSSAELSEAINSMFRWYEQSAICFVHLADVEKVDIDNDPDSAFQACRWLTRGWTLQELLAPTKLVFYDSEWQAIGDRSLMAEHIQRRTAIPVEYLAEPRQDFRRARVGQRMSWASDRNTTRKEDLAYCLFGVFDINMPLLYGEGERAFRRLQEEIIRTSEDDSIFAWSPHHSIESLCQSSEPIPHTMQSVPKYSPLAESPTSFSCLKYQILPHIRKAEKTWKVTTGGLRVSLPVYRRPKDPFTAFLLLNGVLERNINQVLALEVQRRHPRSSDYVRIGFCVVDWATLAAARYETIYVREPGFSPGWENTTHVNWIQAHHLLIKVATGLDDHVVSICYFSWGLVTVHPTTNWSRLGVKMRTGCTDYILIVEKRDISWAFWLSKHWLCRPVTTHLFKMPGKVALKDVIGLPYSALRRNSQSCMRSSLARAIRQKDLCSMGSFVHLIHIEDALQDIGSVREDDIPNTLPWGERMYGRNIIVFAFMTYISTGCTVAIISLKIGPKNISVEEPIPHTLAFSTAATISALLIYASCVAVRLLIGQPGLINNILSEILDYLRRLRGLLLWMWHHGDFIFRVWRWYVLTFGCVHFFLRWSGVVSCTSESMACNASFVPAMAVLFKGTGAIFSVECPELSIRGRILLDHFVTQPLHILAHPGTWSMNSIRNFFSAGLLSFILVGCYASICITFMLQY